MLAARWHLFSVVVVVVGKPILVFQKQYFDYLINIL